MQSDGNLVVYEGGRPLWASNSNVGGFDGHLILQEGDKNAVIYHRGRDTWASRHCNPGWRDERHFIVMQNDGNLVQYCERADASHAVWATGTTGGRDVRSRLNGRVERGRRAQTRGAESSGK